MSACDLVDEKGTWTAALEAEERQRLGPLKAHLEGLEAGRRRTPEEINAVLVSALQAEITLLRMTRVFPRACASRRMNVMDALAHGPTAELGWQLYRCWRALGVSEGTQKVILRDVFTVVGAETANYRKELFRATLATADKGTGPEVHNSLAAEGSGK